MSNYKRNNTMVACIIAFIIVGGAAVGGLILLGGFNWDFNPIIPPMNWDVGEQFEFSQNDSSMPATVTLDIDVSAGGILIVFVDDAELLYDIDMWVPNSTLVLNGDPEVTYSSSTIGLNYPAAEVNVTLGTGTKYMMDVSASTGGVQVKLANNASIGDVDVEVTTGGVSLDVSNDIRVSGDVTFNLDTTTGGITVEAVLPSNVAGQFRGGSSTGHIGVTATGWEEITSSYYETLGFATAANRIYISADTTTGGVTATLS
jgi:hypothetical protein